jgi:hypothetical protein
MPSGELTPEQAIHMQHQKATIVSMRAKRETWAAIAAEVGHSVNWTRILYQRALAEIPALHVEELRAEELTLIDDGVANLMPIALGTPKSIWSDKLQKEIEWAPGFKERIEAWTAILKFSERKAKMMGLDAPQQHTITIDNIQAEIDKLTEALAIQEANEPVEESLADVE